MKRGTLCVTLLLLGCTTHTAQFTSQDTRSLDGQWQYHDANPPFDDVTQVTVPSQQWKTITVPANWYSAGVAHQGALWYTPGCRALAGPHERAAGGSQGTV